VEYATDHWRCFRNCAGALSFYATGLHCQAQKGRRTVLAQWGEGEGGQGAVSILRFEHLWISDSMLFRSLVVSCVRTRVLFFIN